MRGSIASTLKGTKALVLVALVVAMVGLLSVIDLRAPRVPSLAEGPSEDLLVGRRFTEPGRLDPFTLIDQRGQSFGLARVLGQWSFAFFGFTHCPDVCPTTLLTYQQMRRLLGDELERKPRVQFLFVSVDPERDTPQVLDSYVSYFGEGLLGLTGDGDTIRALSQQLGAFFRIVDQPGGDYLVEHSGSILLIDPEGRLAAVFPSPHRPAALVDAFRNIRDGSMTPKPGLSAGGNSQKQS